MVIDRHIPLSGHVIHLAIEQSAVGWEIREEIDSTIVHVEHHNDWQRVEWAVDRLEREVRHGRLDTHH